MIAFVRGTVAHAGPDRLIIDVGPVGLAVQCTPSAARSVHQGEHVELMTSLVVREDGWTLYGFMDADEPEEGATGESEVPPPPPDPGPTVTFR